MVAEVIVNEGRQGLIAAAALSKGQVVTIDSAGKWAKADASMYCFILLNDVASGAMGAAEGRSKYEVYALVDGTTDVAVGDLLEAGTTGTVGTFVKRASATALAVALVAQAANSAVLTRVILL